MKRTNETKKSSHSAKAGTSLSGSDAIAEVRRALYGMQDSEYRDFQSKLIPSVRKDDFIGVRTPELRRLAKGLVEEAADQSSTSPAGEFLNDLPHRYFDENQLHAFIISMNKDFDLCMAEVERFLPYIDNWATCDQLSPKVFKKNRPRLLKHINKWIRSDETYTVRFGIKMLMEHFLDEDFSLAYPERVFKLQSNEYYVNMMIAWYFATALAKQYDSVLPFIEEQRLMPWTHNKAIQKAVESRRITPEQKDYLKTLRIKR